MDMQKEREAFESVTNTYHCIYNADLNFYFSGSKFVPDDAERIVNAGWKAWQAAKASAVPEGFRVVGLEFLKEINRIAVDEFYKWDLKKEPMPPICEHLQDLSYYITNGKVMIEAQEQSE